MYANFPLSRRYMYEEEEEEEDYNWQVTPGQSASVSGKHYEWQLSDGRQWLSIDNDHVIETHYCQPGARGITINTASYGRVYIDFDKLETQSAAMRVQRLSFLPPGQTEDVGWYFRDDKLWCEYGTKDTNGPVSSVSSRDVEHQFTLSPRGTFRFTVGSTAYTLNFSAMAQTNCHTGVRRNVRRRPKLNSTLSSTGSLFSDSVLPTAASSLVTGDSFKWEFMGEEGQWTEYQAHRCSFDSAAIESQYQQNPQGQLHFRVDSFSYTLDFSGMCQVNNNIGTKRSVRRTTAYGSQLNSRTGTLPRWRFQDVDGTWRDYAKGRGECSVSSQEIEIQYQQNLSGTMSFNTRNFNYELDFSAMTQRNLSTNTTRSVQRLNQ
ncbi:uncharacterized protein [Centroberyx affinis]|uniref:uncharacterized protein isoform X2 n=1 Tax=Centroberyx affinis TaxID=166261 RepID=UPI003A5C149B